MTLGNLPVNDDLARIVFGFVPHGPLGGLGFKRASPASATPGLKLNSAPS
jgi:hypothetical protein